MQLRQQCRVMRLFIRQVDGETLPLEVCEQRMNGIYPIHPSLGRGRYEGNDIQLLSCNKAERVRDHLDSSVDIYIYIYVNILNPLCYKISTSSDFKRPCQVPSNATVVALRQGLAEKDRPCHPFYCLHLLIMAFLQSLLYTWSNFFKPPQHPRILFETI